VRTILRVDSPETITAAITGAAEEAREAGAEAARQAEIAEAELDDRTAEAALARSRAEDRRRRRAEALVVDLRERLVATQWEERNRAFKRYQRELAKLAQRVVDTMQEAVVANAALAAARHAAIGEVGNDISTCPAPYLGLPLPDLFGTWRRQAERQLATLSSASLPPPPPMPGTVPAPVQPVAAQPRLPVAAIPLPAPAPVPPSEPAPRPRQPLREGPAGDGQRQVHILGAGFFDLGDGRTVVMGDRVNLPEWQAKLFVERGVADFVDASDEVPSAPAAEPERELVTEAAANG
jgi:hypothetical protein